MDGKKENRGNKRRYHCNDKNFGQKKMRNGCDGSSILADNPSEVLITEFAESRATEIQVLTEQVRVEKGGKSLQQKLPPHMRRRALSHNIKRLPRSTRERAEHNYVNQEGLVKKTPSRYFRRRPKNLLQEYNRRQRSSIWLETHIWHAKRFIMVEKWGFKLPWKPTQKSERAAYRACTQHCLLQDMSYMCCIQLTGTQPILLEGLSHLANPATGQTFAAVSCLAGTREGQTVMYRYDKYPWQAIGPVWFLWQPQEPGTGDGRHLWLWCHPGCFTEMWEELAKLFQLSEVKDGSSRDDNLTDKIASPKEGIEEKSKDHGNRKDKKKPYICDQFKTDVVMESKSKDVKMTSLTGSILRYRLTGPQSNAVLVDALQPADIIPVSTEDQPDLWWKTYFSKEHHSKGHDEQREIMSCLGECQSPAELPPHCVIGITVKDPRLNRPEKRTKVESKETNISSDMRLCKEKITPDVSTSALWENQVRDQVFAKKQTDHSIHQQKADHLIPGTPLELGDAESRVPIILIQRPGARFNTAHGIGPCLGRGSGWDVLLPRGWGMAFWQSVVFRGGRAAGLREMGNSSFEERCLMFPGDYPDTQTGSEYNQQLEKESVEKYNKRPPAKRPNYTKLGVASPFLCPWSRLINGKCSPNNTSKETNRTGEKVKNHVNIAAVDIPNIDFYVLRDFKLLRRIQTLISGKPIKGMKLDQSKLSQMKTETVNTLQNYHEQALVPVQLEMLHRGVPSQFSVICLPDPADLKALCGDKNYGGPVESLHNDPLEEEKKKLKKEMKEKKLKKKVKIDRSLKVFSERHDVDVNMCSRRVVGYLNSGGFSLGTGSGGGMGFVAVSKIKELIEGTGDQRDLVLVRGTSTVQYRFAKLTMIV